MSKTSIPLSRMISSYSDPSVTVRAEVSPFDPEIHDDAGTYLQIVDGCGYTVIEFSPEEAEQIAKMLIVAAAESRRAFEKKA